MLSNNRQMEMARALLNSSLDSSVSAVVPQTPLLAGDLAPYGISLPIASNQWILEAENWFKIGLFNLQRVTVDFATGPSSPYSQFVPLNQWSNDSDLRWLCDSQVIKRSDYINFYSLSFGFIFGLGAVIYAINQSLETLVGWVRLKTRSGRWRQRAWWAEGTLQLQRRAFEGMGVNDWELDEWDRVPVTEKGRVFSAMKNWDEMLPRPFGQRTTPASNSLRSSNSNSMEKVQATVQLDSNISSLKSPKEVINDGEGNFV